MGKVTMKLEGAQEIAQRIHAALLPFCSRIDIAGSVRRRKAEVGDIEIVALPIFKLDLFGIETDEHLLNDFDYSTIGKIGKNGSKYKQIELNEGINLDLFIVTPPAQYGVQLLIRTGPSDFSHRFVMQRVYGGMLHNWQKVKDGALWEHGKAASTPSEKDVFLAIGEKYVEPWERK